MSDRRYHEDDGGAREEGRERQVPNRRRRSTFDNDHLQEPLASPPYSQTAMSRSQATLPPQYFENSGAGDVEGEGQARGGQFASDSRLDEKRRSSTSAADDDEVRSPITTSSPQSSSSRRPVAPALRIEDEEHHITPLRIGDVRDSIENEKAGSSNPLQNSTSLAGETLVQGRGRVVQYLDEHGGVLHTGISDSEIRERRPPMERGLSTASAKSDDESDNDETYDWSTEEDLVDEEAKFEARIKGADQRKKKRWGPKRIALWFFSTLIGTMILTGALVAVPILLLFFYYKPHPDDHRKYVYENVAAWLYWLAANLFISWYLALAVNIFPHIFTWAVTITWGGVSEQFKTSISAYEAFKGWIKPILYAASGFASWEIIFANIFKLYDDHDSEASYAPYTRRLREVVEFFFFLILICSIAKILIQIIAFTFHRTAFKERIDEVNKALGVLDHLKDYRPKRKPGIGNRASAAMGNALSHVSGTKTPNFKSRPNTPDLGVLEDGFADVEDHTPTANVRKDKRKSWLGGLVSGNQSLVEPGPESMPMTPSRSQMDSHFNSLQQSHTHSTASPTSSGAPSRNQSRDFDLAWRRNAHRQNPSSSSGHGPGHSYPPGTKSDGHSNDNHSDDGIHLATAAKAIKSAVLHDARNIKGKDTTDLDVSFMISSPSEAKKLARNLYNAFRADRKRTFLIPSDFYPAYKTPEEAKEAFKIFDKDGNENITRAEIKTKVMRIYKERRFLSRSLKDVGQAIGTLDGIIMFFALVIVFFISLSVFNVDYGKSLTSVYTLGIAASFVFKNAASNAFDAIVFLFVTHPYDTGDRCFIDGENLVVKKMSLFATTFIRADGTQTYYFNTQLNAKFIINARRSPNMGENLTMQINWRTPLEKIDALEKALNHWMATDENRWFQGETAIMLQHIDFMRSLELTIYIPYSGNWQDWGAYLTRKTAFHAACNHYCKELGISWSNSPQPVLTTTFDDRQPYYPPLDESADADLNEDEEEPSGVPAPAGDNVSKPTSSSLFFKLPPDEGASRLRWRSRNKSRKRAHGGVM